MPTQLMAHGFEPTRPGVFVLRPILLLWLSTALGFTLPGCATRIDLDAERQSGRAQAERDHVAGVGELRIGCGTIAPGPCSSVEQELRENAWSEGYNRRLRELRRLMAPTQPSSMPTPAKNR